MHAMNDHLAHLTPKQVKAIPLLATGASAAVVSKQAHVSPGQLSEWKKDQKFMSALAEARRHALSEAGHELASLALEAVRTLRVLMLKSPSEAIRLRATSIVLSQFDLASVRMNYEPTGASELELHELLSALVPEQKGSV